MTILNNVTAETITSSILILIVIGLRIVVDKLVKRYARNHQRLERRANLVIKYIHLLINILAIIILIVIWGVEKKDILLTVSSITTVVGVAMFAQWSILSNITSGVILFFFFPFRIGDVIKIHDKDFPIQGIIEDINAFHIHLKLESGETATYPNNLLLQKGISIIKDTFEDKEFTD
ncbi:mechanosensitive ion channel domain-containing protein [Flavobacterium sp. SUN052]|uniref:mechanosensitive ion channel domain-containing protein n=1 Tax=Flavobacterium sp. SUN052 TaxID=3002441 RepID=UPI00237DC42A|nr:mechanosensitive ion channel domain-containing protein [Flavobacterium sp. SUN052]MEC4005599.1 mechanosensitive ion channel domain-containing protein [Flavobacterium sp. SUN052]